MPRPVCVPCQRVMTQTRMGVVVEFTRRTVTQGQAPYQKFSGDEYQCTECGARVVAAWGKEPVHSHDPAYAPFKADITVPELIR